MPPIDARYWRDRAAEALMQAAEMHDKLSRCQLIQIAVGYDHLAGRAEQIATAGTDSNPVSSMRREEPTSENETT